MVNMLKKPVKIKRKFYTTASLILTAIVLITVIASVTLIRNQEIISQRYEETTIKHNAINDLENSLTQVLFRARGYYAFQAEYELNLLATQLEAFEENIIYFSTLDLSAEELELKETLETFYTNYTEEILPLAIGYVEADNYAALRELSSTGTNAEVNRFLNYTQAFNEESAAEREAIYQDTSRLISQFTFGFILVGLVSFILIIIMVSRLLRSIISPLLILNAATVQMADGKAIELAPHFKLEELDNLAQSFQHMAVNVQEKESELVDQNAKLMAQQQELQANQVQLQDYVTEIEHIKRALDKSALVCITNDKGIIISANEKFCETSQYKAEELLGNTTRILKSGYQSSDFYDEMWHTIEKGKIWTGKLKNEAKDGSHYWINATIVPFLNESGYAYRYILIGIDITENKQNEQKLKVLLSETQKAKEKTENYSNLNKELTVTVNRHEFLTRVFTYFNGAFSFDKGILVSVKQKQYAEKGMSASHAQQFLEEDYIQEMLIRLKSEHFFVIKREITPAETGMAESSSYSYDLYAAVVDDDGEVELVFAITRIGHPFTNDEVSEINVLMGQLSVALSRINIYEDVQHARSLNESIIQNVNEGLQLVSLHGELLQANDKLLELVGIKTSYQRYGKEQEKWIDDFSKQCQDREEIKQFYNETIDPDFKDMKSIRCRTNGSKPRYIQLYASPVLLDNEKTGTIFVYRDITKEYEVDEMKSELVSTVSHELRTPLSSVLGFTEMLLVKELKPEKQKKYLETIYKEAKRLTALINDFLDVQRIESGKQEYQMTNVVLNQLIMEVINGFKHEHAHAIYLRDEAVVTQVWADYDRLIQLFTNLISNAVKFSPEGGKVAIRIRNTADEIIVSVTDEGIGIPENELKHMFTKFKRIDNSASQKIGGTGLGLAISKAIVEAHQGKIWIESVESIGTSVLFSLPINDNSDQPDQLISKHQTNTLTTKGNVMLVEDDISFALLLSESLKQHGFNVLHYLSGQNVLALAEEMSFVAIVVDLVLEESMSGWDLIRDLSTHEKTKSIPIIISSAIDKTTQGLENYPIHDYLVKPYSPQVLTDIMLTLDKK